MEIQCYCSNSFFFLSPHSVGGKVCGNIIILVSKFIIRIPHQHSPARAPAKILLISVPGSFFSKLTFIMYPKKGQQGTISRFSWCLLFSHNAMLKKRPPMLFCGQKVGPKRPI